MQASELHALAGNHFRQGQMLLRAGSVRLTLESDAEAEKLLTQARDVLRPLGRTKSLARCLSALASARLFARDVPPHRHYMKRL